MQKYIFRRRRAISNVVAAALLIGIVVAAVALIWFLIAPMFTPRVGITVYDIATYDNDGDHYIDQIEFKIKNTGTVALEFDVNINQTGTPRPTIQDSGVNIATGNKWASDYNATITGIKRVIGPGEEILCTVYIGNDAGFGLTSGSSFTIYIGIKTTGTTYTFTP